jgi:hypothetical protein
VIVWVPGARPDVVKLASPPARELVPRVAASSLKVTDPVGTPPVEVVVAANVTDCPETEGFRDELTDMVVIAAAPVSAPDRLDCADWLPAASRA